MIGHGDISFRYERWITDDYLCNLVPYVHISDTTLKVKGAIYDGQWIFQKLYIILPNSVIDNIISVLVDNNLKDVMIWNFSPNGIYTNFNGCRWLDSHLMPQYDSMMFLELVMESLGARKHETFFLAYNSRFSPH